MKLKAVLFFLWFQSGICIEIQSPVILIPGWGGSKINAEVTNPSPQCHALPTVIDWLDQTQFTPDKRECALNRFQLKYDFETGKTENQHGVKTTIPGWGDPSVVESVSPDTQQPVLASFHKLGILLNSFGYENGFSKRAAPYDWRKAPNENQKWFKDLKQLIEETYEMNQQKTVTLMSFGTGSSMTVLFLNRQNQKWKDKFILRLISISGTFAGSARGIKTLTFGEFIGSMPDTATKEAARSMPSIAAYYLPSENYWGKNEIIVKTKARSYSVDHLDEYFADIGVPELWLMREATEDYTNLRPPGVKVYCIYSTGIPTLETLVFDGDTLTESPPSEQAGNGDGWVNLRSLQVCESWRGKDHPVFTKTLNNIPHHSMLDNPQILDLVTSLMDLSINGRYFN